MESDNSDSQSLDFSIVENIIKKYTTPLLLISAKKIHENIRVLKNLLPDIEFFYAIKANPHPEILKLIIKEKIGVEVGSINEFNLALSCGIDEKNIIASNPIKSPEEISFYKSQGINLFIYENEDEIKKLKEISPNSDVLLRIKTINPHCIINLSYKFGVKIEEIPYFIKLAKENGLNPRGIFFHTGSQTLSSLPFTSTLENLSELYRKYNFDVLNIGGGFPIQYKKEIPKIEEFLKPIEKILQDKFKDVKIIAEPGRFIIGDSAILVSKVIGKNKRDEKIWYYIDDSIYGSFSGKIYDKAEYEFITNKNGERYDSVIAGRTCDSFDIIEERIKLPLLEIGDIIIALKMGAYTYSSSSEFNGFDKPLVKIVENFRKW